MSKSLRMIALASCLLLVISAAPAAAPKTPAVPLITVVKTDGTSVRGTFVSADPDQVTITPAPKPGTKVAADAPPAEPVVIEWKEIKNVSNGLTKAKAIAAWKEAHIAELCETCHGERAVLCPTCKGTMHDPAAGKDCKTCKGELLVNCKGPKCKDGKTPCPRTCLKLAEGKWVKKEDGKTWRSISTGVGTWQYSSGHAGELIDMKTGQSLGKCPTCGGKQIVECATCVGLGKVPCATCTARKDAAACPDQCELGKIPCDACKGKGLRGG